MPSPAVRGNFGSDGTVSDDARQSVPVNAGPEIRYFADMSRTSRLLRVGCGGSPDDIRPAVQLPAFQIFTRGKIGTQHSFAATPVIRAHNPSA